MRRMLTTSVSLLILATAIGAQTRPSVTRADYGQWESLSIPPRGALSPDGTWIAYSISRSNRENDLRLLRLADDRLITVPYGSQLSFSANSMWAVYAIGLAQAEQDRLREARQPVQNRLGLANLATGETTVVDGVQAFALSADGGYLSMRRYPPQPSGGPAQPAGAGGRGGRGRGASSPDTDETDPVGATLIVRNLATGQDTTFGNVSASAWQSTEGTHLLAMTIAAEGRSGNGVHLFDPATGVLRVLDSSPAVYAGLSWRNDAPDLAVLRARTDETREGQAHVVLAWRGVGSGAEQALRLDPATTSDFPADTRIVSSRVPSWSEDGRRVSIGVAEWLTRPAAPAGDRGGGSEARAGSPEPADVDIWHWQDTTVMARQKTAAAADRRRNLPAVWHLDSGRFVQLGRSFSEQVSPLGNTDYALVEDSTAYEMARSIGRTAADLHLVDLRTGARTPLRQRVDDRHASASPGGRYVLFLEDNHWWTIDVTTRAVTNISRSARTSFVDLESDQTVAQKPPFGIAGWTPDDRHVLVYDKLDIWQLAADGSAATRLTNGSPDEVRHRHVSLDPEAETITLGEPTYVSLFGLKSKQSGYGLLAPGRGVERLVFESAAVTSLTRAGEASVLAFMSQRHDDSPDVFVSGPSLAGARLVTRTNAFQADFAWSRSEIVSYRSEKGLPLQGALYYPAGYEPGRAYPMIVYLYERLSDNVHRYVTPSETSYYNTTVFTSQGYFVLQPDISFRPREPGLSVVECVRPAVKAVVDRGLADARRVGVVGHSWGGFDSSFLAAHTTTFAAAVAGAPINNLVSNYGNHHWSSGIAETDHIETGQQRMEVPLYEDLQAYIRNSAVFRVHEMSTPLLLMTGDNDGTVFWHQSVELYNIARRAGKNVVMLVYNGEDHSLRVEKNQIDYQQRILDWFGHYLKGEAAKPWITDGRSFLERERGGFIH